MQQRKRFSVTMMGVCVAVTVIMACSSASMPGGSQQPCSYNSDCPYGEKCGPAETCIIECQEDRDCFNEKRCNPERGCYDPDDPLDPNNPSFSGDAMVTVNPPREVAYDPASGSADIPYSGCILDGDCSFGQECRGGRCADVDWAAPCEWDYADGMSTILLLDVSLGGMSYKFGERLACGRLNNPDRHFVSWIDDQHVHFRILYYNTPGESTGLPLAAKISAGFFSVAANYSSYNMYYWQYDALGNQTWSTQRTITNVLSEGYLYPHSGDSYLWLTNHSDGRGSVRSVGPGHSITIELGEDFRLRDIASDGSIIISTSDESGTLFTNFRGNQLTLAGHRGLAVYHDGDGKFGWFTISSSGMIHLSTAALPTGAWTTISTGISDACTAIYDAAIEGRATVHPMNGNPLLVYTTCDHLLALVARKGDIWTRWTVPTYVCAAFQRPCVWREGFSHRGFKPRWVGCGKPAVEYIGNGLFYTEVK